jgi:hypothetical protein
LLNCPSHDCGRASISCQEFPAKRTRRSLTDSPGLRELTARQGKRGAARAGVRLHARPGHAPPDLAPKPPHLSSQRVKLGTRDRHHPRRFHGHAQLPPLTTVAVEPSSEAARSRAPTTQPPLRRARYVPVRTAKQSKSRSLRDNGHSA